LYLAYHEETKDEAQQRIWTFYEAIKIKWNMLIVEMNHCMEIFCVKTIFERELTIKIEG
jgi:hypothetical protein